MAGTAAHRNSAWSGLGRVTATVLELDYGFKVAVGIPANFFN